MLSDMLPTERIARATWLLAQGEAVTVRHLAERLEITPRGARAMLEKLSRVVPLIDDGRVCGEEEERLGD
jgi:predicted DNA-binding transcriptional regulator YafY